MSADQPAAAAAPAGVIDSDVDLRDPAERAETARGEWDILLAIAVGGVAGAEARYALANALPHGVGAWAWSTLITNVIGCVLIGALQAVLLATRPRRLVRPLLGVGVLGGFTTFSTFSVDTFHLLDAGRPGIGVAYVVVTLAACLGGTVVGGLIRFALPAAAVGGGSGGSGSVAPTGEVTVDDEAHGADGASVVDAAGAREAARPPGATRSTRPPGAEDADEVTR